MSFQPKAEFSGTVVIPYMGTDSTGTTYQGVVQITVTPPASAPRFSDMGNYGWAAPGVEFLAHYGITTGTGTGATFSPADQLTRCDYLLMLVRTFGFTAAGTDNFSDVPAGSYYASALATAKALGIAQAEAGNTFRPTAPVTREDAMVFLYRAMQKAGRGISSAQDSFLTRRGRHGPGRRHQGGSGGPAQPPGHPHPGRDGRHPPPGPHPLNILNMSKKLQSRFFDTRSARLPRKAGALSVPLLP